MACGYTAVFVFAEIEVLMRTVAEIRGGRQMLIPYDMLVASGADPMGFMWYETISLHQY